jgi:ferredoxin
MACVDACPSGAISMIPDKYPPQQKKAKAVVTAQRALGRSKVRQEGIATMVAATSDSAITRQFAWAIAKSNLRMAEDILRESGYMLPQSAEVREFLETLLEKAAPDFPKDAAELLLDRLQKSLK